MLDNKCETFLAVSKFNNYTKAAKELNITQPAVSQHIKQLEDFYGVKLVNTTSKSVSLTSEGTLLKNALLFMQNDQNRLIDIFSTPNNQTTKLKFGVTLTVGAFIIPDKLAEFIKMHPNIKAEMIVENTESLLTKLKQGEIDFAIVEGFFAKNEFNHKIFKKEAYVGVCSISRCFESPVDFTDLLSENLIIRESGSGTRDIFEKSLESHNLSVNDFNNIIEISNIDAIKNMVAADAGITFMYKAAIKDELKRNLLQIIPIIDYNPLHNITFISPKRTCFSNEIEELYDFFKV
ncbi:MAG: LysR family transcriptional regulator [Anaerovoracaceae bacterium]